MNERMDECINEIKVARFPKVVVGPIYAPLNSISVVPYLLQSRIFPKRAQWSL